MENDFTLDSDSSTTPPSASFLRGRKENLQTHKSADEERDDPNPGRQPEDEELHKKTVIIILSKDLSNDQVPLLSKGLSFVSTSDIKPFGLVVDLSKCISDTSADPVRNCSFSVLMCLTHPSTFSVSC